MKLLTLVSEVAAQIEMAPEAVVVSAVRASIAALCNCDVYQVDCDAISERAGQQQYELSVPDGVIILKVLGVYRAGRKLLTIPRIEFEEAAQKTGQPEYFMRSGGVVRLAPVPREAARSSVQCRVAVAPSRTTTEIDDDFANTYFDLIVRGAVVALLEMPMKSWTSPTQASLYRSQLESEYGTARARAKGLLDGMRIVSGMSAPR